MTDTAFTVTIDEARSLATITLGRPDTGNKLTTDEVREIGTAIRQSGNRPDIKAVVVRANGDAFCLGRAPGAAGAKPPKTALDIRTQVAEPILGLYADVRATEVPVIAVVNGEAKGFGCAFVSQCDLAIAADTARFSLVEMDVNLPPTLAMSACIGKIPPKRLLHMVLTRWPLDARSALDMGLVSEVHPRADLDTAAEATIGRLIDRSRPALCVVKEYLLNAMTLDPAASARLAGNAISVVLASQD